MMTLLILLLLFYQVAAVNSSSGVKQDSGLKSALLEETATLHCFYQSDTVTFFSWYHQRLGGKPVMVSTRMKHRPDADISPEYKERFEVVAQEDKNDLKIKNLQLSDSGTYFCGILEFNTIEFGQGVFLHVRTSLPNTRAVVNQAKLEPLGVGKSVNLSCSVHTESCAGKQRIYWLKHGAAQPAVVYHSDGDCVEESEPHEKTCTVNLTLKSVSSSDVGMYYCALDSCGEIVFGNGTKVQIKGPYKAPSVLLYCLSVMWAVSVIVLFILAFITYKMKKKLCSTCKGTVSELTDTSALDTTNQDDVLHYAALSLNRASRRQCQIGSVETDCVYSRVRRN